MVSKTGKTEIHQEMKNFREKSGNLVQKPAISFSDAGRPFSGLYYCAWATNIDLLKLEIVRMIEKLSLASLCKHQKRCWSWKFLMCSKVLAERWKKSIFIVGTRESFIVSLKEILGKGRNFGFSLRKELLKIREWAW